MIDPRHFDVLDWTRRTTPLIIQYGGIPILRDADDWPHWASMVVSLPALASVGAPRPEAFADWRAWAHKFNEALTLSALG